MRAGATTMIEQVQIRASFQKVVFLRQKTRGRKQKAGSRKVLDRSRRTGWKEPLEADHGSDLNTECDASSGEIDQLELLHIMILVYLRCNIFPYLHRP